MLRQGTVEVVNSSGSVLEAMERGSVFGLPNVLGVRDIWDQTYVAGPATELWGLARRDLFNAFEDAPHVLLAMMQHFAARAGKELDRIETAKLQDYLFTLANAKPKTLCIETVDTSDTAVAVAVKRAHDHMFSADGALRHIGHEDDGAHKEAEIEAEIELSREDRLAPGGIVGAMLQRSVGRLTAALAEQREQVTHDRRCLHHACCVLCSRVCCAVATKTNPGAHQPSLARTHVAVHPPVRARAAGRGGRAPNWPRPHAASSAIVTGHSLAPALRPLGRRAAQPAADGARPGRRSAAGRGNVRHAAARRTGGRGGRGGRGAAHTDYDHGCDRGTEETEEHRVKAIGQCCGQQAGNSPHAHSAVCHNFLFTL